MNTNQCSWLWRLLYLSCLELNVGLGIISSFLHLSSLGTGQSLKQGNRSFLSCRPCEVARTVALPLPAVLRRRQTEQNADVMTEMQSALTNRAFTWGHGALISRVVECDKQPSKCCDFPSSSMEASQLEHKWRGGRQPKRSLIGSEKHKRTPDWHQLLKTSKTVVMNLHLKPLGDVCLTNCLVVWLRKK